MAQIIKIECFSFWETANDIYILWFSLWKKIRSLLIKYLLTRNKTFINKSKSKIFFFMYTPHLKQQKNNLYLISIYLEQQCSHNTSIYLSNKLQNVQSLPICILTIFYWSNLSGVSAIVNSASVFTFEFC